MEKEEINILFVEDSADDAELIARQLRKGGFQFTSECVEDAAGLRAALHRVDWDIVICDHVMPQFNSFMALKIVREECQDTPFIVVSGTIGEEVAVEVMKAGANDYLLKENLIRLVPAVRRELEEAASRRQRRQAEVALRKSEAHMRLIADNLPVFIAHMDKDLRYQFANETAAEWYRLPAGDFVGKHAVDVVGDEIQRKIQRYIDKVLTGERVTFTESNRYPDGKTRDVQISYVPDISDEGQVRGFFSLVVDLTAHKQTEAALQETEAYLSGAIEGISEGFILYDPDERFIMCNEKFRSFYPRIENELVPGAKMADLARLSFECGAVKTGDENVELWLNAQMTRQRSAQGSHEQELTDGRWLLCSERKTADGLTVGIRTDITEVKKTADQLRQSQRLEAVGQLTGGIAHDFNNILAAVIGNLDLIEADRIADEGDRDSVAIALHAAVKGAELTHRLLAFSRRQPLNAKNTRINEILPKFIQLAGRTIGENIAVKTTLAADLWSTMVDVGQLENALLNLAINARDAMPDGGQLIIETANQVLKNSDTAAFEDLVPGDYVMISVSDSGLGMPAEIISRVFEPFFTTKDIGEGSGLGLSMVFGFARQTGGQVLISSEEGEGTTVRIYLPRAEKEALIEGIIQPAKLEKPTGKETILVVEDNKDLLGYLVKALDRLGYTTLEAEDGPAALDVMAASERIDLLLTDVILPQGMSGRDVANTFQARYPAGSVLYSSGYTREALNLRGQFDEDVALLSKPYRTDVLAQWIRRVLDDEQML